METVSESSSTQQFHKIKRCEEGTEILDGGVDAVATLKEKLNEP